MELYTMHMGSLYSKWCIDGNPPYPLTMLFSDLNDCNIYTVTELIKAYHDLQESVQSKLEATNRSMVQLAN